MAQQVSGGDGVVGAERWVLREVSRILATEHRPRPALRSLLGLCARAFGAPVVVFEVDERVGWLRLVAAEDREAARAYQGGRVPAGGGRLAPGCYALVLSERLVAGWLSPVDPPDGLAAVAPALRLATDRWLEERSLRQLGRRARTNERLIAALVAPGGTIDARLVREARLLAGAETVLLVDVGTTALMVRAAAGASLRRPGDLLGRDRGLLDWVARTGRSVVIGSRRAQAASVPEVLGALRGEADEDSAAAVPVMGASGRVVGVLAALSHDAWAFGSSELVVLEELAALSAAAARTTDNGLALDEAALGRRGGRELAEVVLERLAEGVALVDEAGVIVYHNPAFARMHGADSLLGAEAWQLESAAGAQHGAVGEPVEERRRRQDGAGFLAETTRAPFRDDAHGLVGTVLSVRDISERSAESQEARRVAHLDPLTGLANRAGFFELAQEALRRSAGAPVGLVFVDVDGLKVVNDQFGHHVGDRVLLEVARRLRQSLRPSDVIGRIGGDEFAVIMTEADSQRVVRTIGERLGSAISGSPITVDAIELRVTAAVGVAVGVAGEVALDQLLSTADSAMYQDKFSRRRPDLVHLQRNVFGHVEIELGPDLVRVLRGDERGGTLGLRFQPLFAVATGEVIAVEALVRWQHPREGLLAPSRFLALALQYRLMEELDAWVRADAMARFGRWREAGVAAGVRLAINLSGVNAAETRTVRDFCQLADRHGIPRELVVIELTETELSDLIIERIARMMKRLKGEGFRIALDDFGVGTSSFRHLQMMPVDVVKIDRQFVRDLGTSGERGLVAGLTGLAHELGIEVVAEGVGDAATLGYLREIGVELAQGFHLARPLRESSLLRMLGNQESVPAT